MGEARESASVEVAPALSHRRPRGRPPKERPEARARRRPARLDPNAMSPGERLAEVSRILAEGYLRLRRDRSHDAADGQQMGDPDAEKNLSDSPGNDLLCPPDEDSCQGG